MLWPAGCLTQYPQVVRAAVLVTVMTKSPVSQFVLSACFNVVSFVTCSDGHVCVLLNTHGAAHWAEAIQLSVLPQNIC